MGLIAPKVGANFHVSDRIGFVVQSSFDFHMLANDGNSQLSEGPAAERFNYFLNNSVGVYLRL